MPRTDELDELGSTQPGTQPSPPTTLKGRYVTLERLAPEHIPLLFKGLGLPQNNHILDWIGGFPYVYSEDDLHNHLFGSMRENPNLVIFALKVCASALGPPSPSDVESRSSVLGTVGYRIFPQSLTIKIDDLLYAPELQRTYASTEAAYLMMCHMWEAQPIAYQRIGVTNNARNVKSRRHTERLGYKYEGTMRKDNVTRWGTPRDTDCLSMLDDEWPLHKKVLQKWLLPTNFDADGKQIKSLDELRAQ